MASLKIAALVSGGGRTLQNLIDLSRAGVLDLDIRYAIGSRPDIQGLKRAADAGIPGIAIRRSDFADTAGFSRAIFDVCNHNAIDLVVLAGWLSLLEIPAAWTGRVMNIHPALLPAFGGKGMYGHHVHEAVLAHGCKISGCTVHFVDNAYDNGPIIAQRVCPVLEDDTPDVLAARVFEQELLAYPEAIALFATGRLKIEGRRVRITPS